MTLTRLLAILALCSSLAAPAWAGSVEALPSGAAEAFQSLASFRLQNPVRRLEARTVKVAPRAVKAAGSQYITLRGHVTIQGSAYVPTIPGFASINFSGSTQLQDSTGHYLSGYVTVSDYSSIFVSGDFLNGFARPSANVGIYKDGKYLGTVRVEGSIPVNGWINNKWVHASGSGYVQGSAYISVPEPQSR